MNGGLCLTPTCDRIVSSKGWDLIQRIEHRAWMRGNDHLPIEDEDQR